MGNEEITITGTTEGRYGEILTPEAVAFVVALDRDLVEALDRDFGEALDRDLADALDPGLRPVERLREDCLLGCGISLSLWLARGRGYRNLRERLRSS